MRSRLVVTIAVIWLTGVWPAHGQELVATAGVLYAEADYDGVLTLLNNEAVGSLEGPARLEADRLRVLCLLALDRAGDAHSLIERLVTARPDYQPGDDYSPRVRLAFRAVRDRVLPPLARDLYDEGRRAYDSGRFAESAESLAEALPVIEALTQEGRPGMADLRVLAREFLALARERTPPPEPAVPPLPAKRLAVEPFMAASAALDAPATPPVAIEQDLPPWPHGLAGVRAELRGAVDVWIDERGYVTEASMTESVHPAYDRELLSAARDWRYEPARRAGQAVSSHKRVEVVLRLR